MHPSGDVLAWPLLRTHKVLKANTPRGFNTAKVRASGLGPDRRFTGTYFDLWCPTEDKIMFYFPQWFIEQTRLKIEHKRGESLKQTVNNNLTQHHRITTCRTCITMHEWGRIVEKPNTQWKVRCSGLLNPVTYDFTSLFSKKLPLLLPGLNSSYFNRVDSGLQQWEWCYGDNRVVCRLCSKNIICLPVASTRS